jgi:predicted GNAT family acetyltransferase
MVEAVSVMSADDVARRRTEMGEAISGWGALPGAVSEVSDDHWVLLSGAPSPDLNLVLVHSSDEKVLENALATVDRFGAPALVCLAGKASEQGMASSWQAVGTMPFMQADLAGVPRGADQRVRVAGPDDVEVTVALLADAYGMDPAVARIAVEPVLTGLTNDTANMRYWTLVEDGVSVSTVLDARAGETITLWCMSTPQRFGRRGHGRALLAHVMDAARQDGMTVGLLGATPAGKPLYDATGWRTVEEWRLFVNGASVQFA